MKTILPGTFAVTLLSGTALCATSAFADPADGQTNPAGSIESKAEAVENNTAHVLNNAASGGIRGSASANMAGKPSSPAAGSSDPSLAPKKTQHVMGEGNSGMNHAETPIPK